MDGAKLKSASNHLPVPVLVPVPVPVLVPVPLPVRVPVPVPVSVSSNIIYQEIKRLIVPIFYFGFNVFCGRGIGPFNYGEDTESFVHYQLSCLSWPLATSKTWYKNTIGCPTNFGFKTITVSQIKKLGIAGFRQLKSSCGSVRSGSPTLLCWALGNLTRISAVTTAKNTFDTLVTGLLWISGRKNWADKPEETYC